MKSTDRCAAGATVAGSAQSVGFGGDTVGAPPKGWIIAMTGRGTPKWTVERDDTAPSKGQVLKQSGTATYPLAFKDGTSIKDGFVEVKFKPIDGSEDRAGGIVWRWKDGDNYYLARANALEDNVRIYHVTKGSRREFKSADVKVTSNQWHTLRAEFTGKHFVVMFDGKKVIEADDDTIKGSGAVGVWTKADSVTAFDDFSFGEK